MVGGINFLALGEILVVSLLAANALVFFFGLFVDGYTRFGVVRTEGRSGAWQAALAVVSLLVCVAIIVAGIYAMISK